MQAMLIVFLLTIGASAIAVAQDSPNISVPPVLPPDVSLPIVPVPVNESLIFSQDLDPDYTPCRSWIFPCGGGTEQCTTQDAYTAFRLGPQPQCPIEENPSPTTPEGTCALFDGVCNISTVAPTCVSWLPDCSTQYACTTEEVYLAPTEDKCSGLFQPPPTPDAVCVPVDDGCEWHDPCTIWQGFCGGYYMCGSQVEFARFRRGPTPICAAPSLPEAVPQGECLYRDGQCEWSQCRSWLNACQTSWSCGTEYEYQVFLTLPLPPCAFPGPDFRPPIEPGVCEYSIEQGVCEFHGEVVCEGGKEYQSCASNCPRTCDNLDSEIFCITVCSSGCACPEGTVLHNDECILPSQCPNANPCNGFECGEGSECQIFEPTGEAFCNPNCEELNPCGPQQVCTLQPVNCVRAPCPPVLLCEDRVTIDVQLSGSGVVVTVKAAGAESIRIIVRDSFSRRYTQSVVGSSASVGFPDLPSGVTSVRATVKLTSGERLSTEWEEIAIPQTL